MDPEDRRGNTAERTLFFRVEHDLLRSESFQQLNGSAIKVYLVIGLYSDFGTDWAHPSTRTIARRAGLSRQTVLTAIRELCDLGLLARRKTLGKTTSYKIIRAGSESLPPSLHSPSQAGPKSLSPPSKTVPKSCTPSEATGSNSGPTPAQIEDRGGRRDRPKQQSLPKGGDDNEITTIPLPGTPFRVTADGRLQVAVDLQELLTEHGLPDSLARELCQQRAPEDVAKVLLNAIYLKNEGRLKNEPGYIRAGLEDGYELLPQVALRIENRHRELQQRLAQLDADKQRQEASVRDLEEQRAITLVLEQLSRSELDDLVARAVQELPTPLVRRNPTLSNPFVRTRVYELAGGEPSGQELAN